MSYVRGRRDTYPGIHHVSSHDRHRAEALAGFGFSLKPPKRLRKVLKKLWLPAAVGAAFFIPGVAPAVASVGRGIATGARAAGASVWGAVSGRKKPGLPTRSLEQAARMPWETPGPRGQLAEQLAQRGEGAGTALLDRIFAPRPVPTPPAPTSAPGYREPAPSAPVATSSGGGELPEEMIGPPAPNTSSLVLPGLAVAGLVVFALASRSRKKG